MNLMPVGIDIAKPVFQVDYVESDIGEVVNKPIGRTVFFEQSANRSPYLIGTEPCGGDRHWARKLVKMGAPWEYAPAKR
jgi:transposase